MKDRWLLATGRQYNSMKNRKSIKALGGLTFTLDEFRFHAMKFFGSPDGVVLCRYCRRPVAIDSCAVDHAVPISRGGSVGLENLEFPCPDCNSQKGSLWPEEFIALLAFLNTIGIGGAKDILNRLQIAVKAVAGKNWKRKKASA